jgi:hypothetical protein
MVLKAASISRQEHGRRAHPGVKLAMRIDTFPGAQRKHLGMKNE